MCTGNLEIPPVSYGFHVHIIVVHGILGFVANPFVFIVFLGENYRSEFVTV